jgi:hypothetical protein
MRKTHNVHRVLQDRTHNALCAAPPACAYKTAACAMHFVFHSTLTLAC